MPAEGQGCFIDLVEGFAETSGGGRGESATAMYALRNTCSLQRAELGRRHHCKHERGTVLSRCASTAALRQIDPHTDTDTDDKIKTKDQH